MPCMTFNLAGGATCGSEYLHISEKSMETGIVLLMPAHCVTEAKNSLNILTQM